MPPSPLPETSGVVAGIHLPSKRGAVKFWFLTIGDRASNPRPIQQSGNLFVAYCRGGLGNINGIWREFPVSEIRLSMGFRMRHPLLISRHYAQKFGFFAQQTVRSTWFTAMGVFLKHRSALTVLLNYAGRCTDFCWPYAQFSIRPVAIWQQNAFNKRLLQVARQMMPRMSAGSSEKAQRSSWKNPFSLPT